jgi:L-ascorbate metabolism protein UlaG (beta-lactamase superfamily)
MVITYHGKGCFRIQSGSLTLLVDPQNARMKPDIFLRTLSPWPLKDEDEFSKGIIGAGEYDEKGVRVRGFQVKEESTKKFLKTMYVVEMEEMRLAFLGHLSTILKPDVFDEFGEIDILFIPAAGKPFLEPEDAAKIVKFLEPKIVIPSFVVSPKEFTKELGQSADPIEKLVVKKKDIDIQGPKVVVLKET